MPEHSPAPTPSRAVYGFALYLASKLFFILFVLWAIIPESCFEWLGIDFLPQRHWAVTIPVFLLTVLNIFAFFIYPSLGLLMTPNIDDLRTITDNNGRKNKELTSKCENLGICSCKNLEKCYRDIYEKNDANNVNKTIPAVRDLNMWDVSKHLYMK